MKTITNESKRFSNLPLNIDYLRNRFLDIDNKNEISVLYPNPEIIAYENNLYKLLSRSTRYKFITRWEMRPDYTSYDIYGTVIHWTVILFINSISSIEDFKNLDYIYIPTKDDIIKLSRDKPPRKDITLLKTSEEERPIYKSRYYKNFPLSKKEREKFRADKHRNQGLPVEKERKCPILQKTESITLTSIDIVNKYIDLEQVPVNESSIKLVIKRLNMKQKYGYDYILTRSSQGYKNRLTWSDDEIEYGSGLEDILKENHTIEIEYLYLDPTCDDKQVETTRDTTSNFVTHDYLSLMLDQKIDKVPSATTNNLASFTSDGGLQDSLISELGFPEWIDGGVFD
ncbi:MAG: hypothetical protein ACOCQD_01005 [archaeon]